ncbi:MAG TPA: ribosome maturation factor RimP [Jatrophihabitans sp.]|nr:ribosome maturation factor RimP [Jatrophihabitans sp.]
MTARSPQRNQLHDLLDPVVSAAGYELVDLSVTSAGRRSLVRVTVDGDTGIDLDGVAVVSRAISTAMDAEDAAFAGPYVLEVSSPGVDRPLTEPRLWKRAVGHLVSVPIADADPVTGRVVAVAADGLVLSVDGAERSHSWDVVGTGRMQVEFSRPGGPATDFEAEPVDSEDEPADFEYEPADEED